MEDIEESKKWYQEMGWHFDDDNDFVDKNGNLFDFESQQGHYEFVQAKIKRHVFQELSRKYDMACYLVPSKKNGKRETSDPTCPQIYITKDVFENKNLLVIVQGLGEVPPGQWARKLFTNGKRGQWKLATQFPYIERAKSLGWAIILCDPNHDENKPKSRKTRAHHVWRVWEDVVRPSKARSVMYASFSAGTTATLDLYETIKPEFMKRVKGVALMDGENGRNKGSWIQENTKTYCQNSSMWKPDPDEVTINTNDHDSVPGLAVDKVFGFLESRCSSVKLSPRSEISTVPRISPVSDS